jgi:hypothetical protein
MKLKQTGLYMGDKGTISLPNLKLGEYRFYGADNPNIISREKIKPEKFKYLFEEYFPDYEIKLEVRNPNQIKDHYFIYLGEFFKKSEPLKPLAFNKIYICIKEATKKENSICLEYHDGMGFLIGEKYYNSQ